MGEKLHNIREKLGIPSGRAIIHVVIVEIAINAIWDYLSRMFTVPLIREIGFLVLIIAVLFAVALYLPKLSPKWSGASIGKKKGINEKSWLYQSLEADKNELGKRIHQFREHWYFGNIHATEPSMEASIKIVNAAVFPIVIKGIEGSFAIQGTKCNWDATVSQSRIPHGESSSIIISQRLLKETVDMMVKLHNERSGFLVDLNSCRLVIQTDEPNVENKPVEILLRIREQLMITA